MDSNGQWNGSIEVKLDTQDSSFKGSGNYNFKIGRYTASGTSPIIWCTNETTPCELIIIAVMAPTPTPTPAPPTSPLAYVPNLQASQTVAQRCAYCGVEQRPTISEWDGRNKRVLHWCSRTCWKLGGRGVPQRVEAFRPPQSTIITSTADLQAQARAAGLEMEGADNYGPSRGARISSKRHAAGRSGKGRG